MKKSIPSIAIAVLLAIPGTGYAQKSEESDYRAQLHFDLADYDAADSDYRLMLEYN